MRLAVPTLLFLAACTPATAQSTFAGIGKAKDGDSLLVGEREVRLFGIDAPEWNQTCKRGGKDWACGQDAAEELSKLVTGREVSCVAVNTDEHGRTVAQCTVNGLDVNGAMVASGFATAYRQYSTAYVSSEQRAKANGLGIWAGTFQLPSEYRHFGEPPAHRRSANRQRARFNAPQQPVAVSGPCNIKGNRGSNGWIYHVPGMPYYDRTRAEEMFCTEEQARAGGYRRAKVN